MTDDAISRCQRKFWKSGGQGIEDFPTASNSRHLRKSRNAEFHESGDTVLQSMGAVLLNHHSGTNKTYYQNFTRGTRIAEAKRKYHDRVRKVKANLNILFILS